MALRIKSTWHESKRNESGAKSQQDNAGALGFILWRLALENAKELHREGFEYASDHERVGVISECLAFEVQLVDRLVYGRIDDAARAELINALGQRLSDHVQDNLEEIAGPGSYREPFIAMLNARAADYAALSFEGKEPGYDFVRYFSDCVLKTMGESQTNRWVFDQISEIVAPDLSEKISKVIGGLLK